MIKQEELTKKLQETLNPLCETNIVLKENIKLRDLLTLKKQVSVRLGPLAEKSKVKNLQGVLKFSKKEILQMTTNYRNVFATNDMIVTTV